MGAGKCRPLWYKGGGAEKEVNWESVLEKKASFLKNRVLSFPIQNTNIRVLQGGVAPGKEGTRVPEVAQGRKRNMENSAGC